MRQVDLASEVGVTRQTIIAIEKERLNPSIMLCLKVARVLREPVDYVFYLDRAPAAKMKPATDAGEHTEKTHTVSDRPRSLFDVP